MWFNRIAVSVVIWLVLSISLTHSTRHLPTTPTFSPHKFTPRAFSSRLKSDRYTSFNTCIPSLLPPVKLHLRQEMLQSSQYHPCHTVPSLASHACHMTQLTSHMTTLLASHVSHMTTPWHHMWVTWPLPGLTRESPKIIPRLAKLRKCSINHWKKGFD